MSHAALFLCTSHYNTHRLGVPGCDTNAFMPSKVWWHCHMERKSYDPGAPPLHNLSHFMWREFCSIH